MERKALINFLVVLMVSAVLLAPVPFSVKRKLRKNVESKEFKVIARGQGIEVTSKDVERLLNRMGIFRVVNKKALEREAVKLKLFALEAKKQGLVKEDTDFLKAAREYELHLLKNYKVPDIVIKSYYYAHYKAYLSDNGTLYPLDDKERERIKNTILGWARKRILDEEAERLMKKYNVTFMAGEKEKGK